MHSRERGWRVLEVYIIVYLYSFSPRNNQEKRIWIFNRANRDDDDLSKVILKNWEKKKLNYLIIEISIIRDHFVMQLSIIAFYFVNFIFSVSTFLIIKLHITFINFEKKKKHN